MDNSLLAPATTNKIRQYNYRFSIKKGPSVRMNGAPATVPVRFLRSASLKYRALHRHVQNQNVGQYRNIRSEVLADPVSRQISKAHAVREIFTIYPGIHKKWLNFRNPEPDYSPDRTKIGKNMIIAKSWNLETTTSIKRKVYGLFALKVV